MHCSRVFRSSVPSDPVPSSPGERPAAPRTVNTAALVQWNGGSASVAKCRIQGVPGKICPPGTLRRHVAGAGPLSGEGRTMRDPELVARAQRAATRLESAWEQWRALHGLAAAPGQPVVSYVGYSLKEPWGEPRVVIGIDADEAEYLAEFLDRDECAQRGLVSFQQSSASSSSAGAAPAGIAVRTAAGKHRRVHEFGSAGRASEFRHGPAVAGSRPEHRRRAGGLDLS